MKILKSREIRRNLDPLDKIRRDMGQIFFLGIAAILIALVAMSTISLRITRNQVLERLKANDLSNAASALSASIESRIERSIETSLLLASDPFILEYVDSEESGAESIEMVRERFAVLVEEQGYSAAFLTVKSTGNYWSATPGEGFRKLATLSPNREGDEWFYETLDMGSRYVVSVDDNVDLGETFLWVNVLMGDVGSPAAITGVGLNLTDVISELISSEKIQGIPADIWFVDGSGHVALSNKEEFMGKELKSLLHESLVEDMTRGASAQNHVISSYLGGGEEYDLIYKPLTNTDWWIAVRIARSKSLGFLERIRINMMLSGFMIVLTVVGLFGMLTRRVADPYRNALVLNRELEMRVAERTTELMEKNDKINASIEAASVIQQAILPTAEVLQTHLGNHAVHWRPKDQVGGDFYWVKDIGDRLAIVLGDCTGHGVPGAMMTMAVNVALEHLVSIEKFDDPSLLLSRLNDEIGNTLGAGFGGKRMQPGLDAVCVMMKLDEELSFSGARLDMFLRRQGEIERISGRRVTIDGTQSDRELKLQTVVIDPDGVDEVYLATDGFFDQLGGEKRLPYGKKRFMKTIIDMEDESLEQKMQILLDGFSKYVGDELLRDDITLLFIKPKKS